MKYLILLVFFLFISTSAIAQLNPQLYENNPVVPIGPTGTWDDSALWWPNVTVVSDTFYVIYNGNDNWPVNPASLGLATSTDGYTFTKSASNPILTPDGNGFDTHSVDDGMLYFENDTWYLYYGGRSSSPNQPGNVIGRATASNPHGPWNRTNDTLLTVGSAGEWDDEFLSPCTILPTDTGLVMYYWAGEAWPNAKPQIGMATSIDGGVTWKKYNNPATTEKPYTESDPVLRPADYESYDDAGIWGCSVLKLEGEWQMFYGGDSDGYTSICYATSENGIVWEKYENNPVLNPPQDPLASSTLNGPAAVIWNSTYFVYYSYGVNDIGISVATSSRYLNVPTDYPTIQGAINTAVDGDIVLVDEGTYYENINFKGKAITVASQFIMDQDTSHISKTIIDGSQPSHADSGSVVYFITGEDTNSVLSGFTVSGGTGTELTLPGLPTFRYGGGIFINENNSARIEWNIIENNIINSNYSAGGGGIFAGDPGGSGYTIIEQNTIRNNDVTGTYEQKDGCAIWMGSSGRIKKNIISNNIAHSVNGFTIGGIRLWSGGNFPVSEVYVTGNTISNNQAISDNNWAAAGGLNSTGTILIMLNNRVENNTLTSPVKCLAAGVHVYNQPEEGRIDNNTIVGNTMTVSENHEFKGGGLFLYDSDCSISNNEITGNYAGYGGGIYLHASNVGILTNHIMNNSAGHSGGGIGCYEGSKPEITNNLIAYNHAGNDAGGIDFYDHSDALVVNNTIIENTAKWGGALAFNSNCDPVFMNSIIYGNSADSSGNQAWFWDDDSDPTFTYCDIEGGSADFGFYLESYTYSGVYKNNMNSDPLFVAGDSLFHLSGTDPKSPCIDAGNPDPLFKDPKDLDNPGFALWPSLGTLLNDMGAYGGQYPLIVTAIKDQADIVHSIPKEFILYQNYPNPFNPTTTISYKLEVPGFVELSIYNVLGQKVATLVSTKQLVGQYKVEWDARRHSSGIYFYRLSTVKGFKQTKKMVVLR